MKNCPILERTGDGIIVGRCWHYTGENQECPRHGDVNLAIKIYIENGQLTDDFDHVRVFSKSKNESKNWFKRLFCIK